MAGAARLARRDRRHRATREPARAVLLDAARLQEEDADCQARQAARRGAHETPQPLYTQLDALNSRAHFGRTAIGGEPIELAPGWCVSWP